MHAFDLRPRIRPRLSRAPRGFTLAELLIAMALGVIVVGAVGMLFISSVTVMGAGNTLHQVSENVRGAFNMVERDLMAAYTSVERGDTKSFFGTPIGFTFIARVGGRESYSPVPRLARVTYVVMRLGSTPAGVYDPTDPDFKFDTIEYYDEDTDSNVTEKVFSLIRYVEYDLDRLDSFANFEDAFSWPQPNDPALPPEDPMFQVSQEFAQIYDLDSPPPGLTPHGPSAVEELISAKKLEVWIRMLAEDPTVPSFWLMTGQDPNDFVVAQNIVSLSERNVAPPSDPPVIVRFEGVYSRLQQDVLLEPNLPYLPFLPPAAIPPRFPDPAPSDLPPPVNVGEALYQEAQESFFEYGLTTGVEVVAYAPYWNAVGNLFFNGDISDMWSTEGRPQYAYRYWLEDLNGDGVDEWVWVIGSPLTPRIPEVLRMNFLFKYPDSTPRGKLIDLNMNQQIDLPSGVTRTAFAENG